MALETLKSPAFYWGAGVGAIIVVVGGFGWGGWYTTGGANKLAAETATKTEIAALAPVCTQQMMANPAAVTKLTGNTTSSWDFANVVNGFAKNSAGKDYSSDVARACALAVREEIEKQQKAKAASKT